jgi:NADH:ubiquinone oxidoreductase subunit 2 (subunit N)
MMATTPYERGEGWLLFASVVLLLVGAFNVVLGLTLIADDTIYVTGRENQVVLIGDTTGWGWVIFIAGILEVIAAFGVLARNQAARWFGIIMATLAALGHLPVIFGRHPVYSFIVVLLSILVIYGLAQYGGRERASV